METKVCTKCKLSLSIEEFYFKDKVKNKRQSSCRVCNRVDSKQHYEKYKDHYKRKALKQSQASRQFLFDYLKGKSCIDCGILDVRVLEFDHISEDKRAGVGFMARSGYGKEAILREIAKCEIRCANCHRIRTFERINSYRSK